jgi:hypothetical protein
LGGFEGGSRGLGAFFWYGIFKLLWISLYFSFSLARSQFLSFIFIFYLSILKLRDSTKIKNSWPTQFSNSQSDTPIVSHQIIYKKGKTVENLY